MSLGNVGHLPDDDVGALVFAQRGFDLRRPVGVALLRLVVLPVAWVSAREAHQATRNSPVHVFKRVHDAFVKGQVTFISFHLLMLPLLTNRFSFYY